MHAYTTHTRDNPNTFLKILGWKNLVTKHCTLGRSLRPRLRRSAINGFMHVECIFYKHTRQITYRILVEYVLKRELISGVTNELNTSSCL